MAPKTTLNAKNLEQLGAQRLAELLIEISTGSAAHKRRLRMELAGGQGVAEVARQVRKRLGSIARARTTINWRKVKALKADLETQRKNILDVAAPDDPKEGLELIWQFLAIAGPVLERSTDESGALLESFHAACRDAGSLATLAASEPEALADRIFSALQDNGYGQYDPLITAMASALGTEGLAHLKTLLVRWSKEAGETLAYAALQDIADAQHDVDGYIALQSEKTRGMPLVAAAIANRLTAAGRAEEALEALDRVDTKGRRDVPFEWETARIEALGALGRTDDAQAFRWQCFEQSLNDQHLRAHLKRLPDFDDLDAEEKAFAYAQAFPDVHRALIFFLRWPDLVQAARLVMARRTELDGDLYELMTAAAEALAEKHPLAATVLLRAMIDFTLVQARSGRYKHAARHLTECASLARHIEDFGTLGSHDAYVAGLKRQHGKKFGFWSKVP